LIYSFLNYSLINPYTFSLSSLNNGFSCFLFKDMDLLVESLKNQFLGLFLDFAAFFFLFQISYSSTTLFTSTVLFFFGFFYLFFFFSCFFSSYFLFSSYIFSFFAFTTLVFLILVSTTFYIFLNILLSLLFPFSSWSQDCGKLATVFPRSLSTFVLQLY